jgi:hypothetical protein
VEKVRAAVPIDTSGDGKADSVLVDTDGDGRVDTAFPMNDDGRDEGGDSDSDGESTPRISGAGALFRVKEGVAQQSTGAVVRGKHRTQASV